MVTIISNPKSQDFHFSLAVRSAVPQICLLLQQSLDGPDPGMPLAGRANLLRFPVQPSEPSSHLCSASGTGRHHFFFFNLASYYQSTTSSPIPQNYSTQVEAAINHLVNLYLQSPTPTSLSGLLFLPGQCDSRGHGPLFLRTGQGEAPGS